MFKRIIFSVLMSAMACVAIADSYKLTEKDQAKITEEAEDWIDDMPIGLQDRISDAVLHAMRGFNSEIESLRNYQYKIGKEEYPVIVEKINGGKNGNVAMRLYKPKNKKVKKLPILIYFHAGGWSIGSLDTSDKFCKALASLGNMMVVSIDYPLSPEKQYPIAVNQATESVVYVAHKAKDWGFDSSYIFLGGDGAGGSVALETYSQLPSTIKIKKIALFYPLINKKGELNADLKRKYGRGYGFDSRVWDAFIQAYKGKETVIPNLPPTLVIGSGRDIVVMEARELGKKKNVTYIEFEGALHGFVSDGHQPTAFNKAVEITNAFLSVPK